MDGYGRAQDTRVQAGRGTLSFDSGPVLSPPQVLPLDSPHPGGKDCLHAAGPRDSGARGRTPSLSRADHALLRCGHGMAGSWSLLQAHLLCPRVSQAPRPAGCWSSWSGSRYACSTGQGAGREKAVVETQCPALGKCEIVALRHADTALSSSVLLHLPLPNLFVTHYLGNKGREMRVTKNISP